MTDLLARLADAVRDARHRGDLRRRVVLSAPAYLETLQPPSRASIPAEDGTTMVTFFPYYRCYAHTLGDPACREFNGRNASAWEAWTRSPWAARPGSLGVCEYWNVSWFKSLPLAFPHVIAADLLAYHDAGVRSFRYMHVPTARWGAWRLNHLVMSQALWSPGFDVDSLLADYAARAYPAAAGPMRDFDAALEAATTDIMAIEVTIGALGSNVPGGRLAAASQPLMPYAHLRPEPDGRGPSSSWPEIRALMRTARSALDRARSAASSPGERARLDEDEARFVYGERTYDLWDACLRLGAAIRGDASVDVRAALADADAAATALRGMSDMVQDAGEHSNARDGLDASHVAAALDAFHRRFDAKPSAR